MVARCLVPSNRETGDIQGSYRKNSGCPQSPPQSPRGSSHGPIFVLQPGNTAKIASVSGHHPAAHSQRHGGDLEAVPHLLPLLDAPPPARFLSSDRPEKPACTVRELVRINHLANCVLCHAPSHDRNDLVRGAVPLGGQPLPPPVAYYEQGQNFVRADVTYLRQHFSVQQPVARPGTWPAYQCGLLRSFRCSVGKDLP